MKLAAATSINDTYAAAVDKFTPLSAADDANKINEANLLADQEQEKNNRITELEDTVKKLQEEMVDQKVAHDA